MVIGFGSDRTKRRQHRFDRADLAVDQQGKCDDADDQYRHCE